MEKKSSRKAFKGWKKGPQQRNVAKRPLYREKKVAEMPLNGEKGSPKGEKRSKRAFK